MSRRLADEFYPKTLLKMDFLHCTSQSLWDSLVGGPATKAFDSLNTGVQLSMSSSRVLLAKKSSCEIGR
jgi:hypothetical protein